MNRNRNYFREGHEEFKVDEELKKKIKLSDETEEFVYARGPKYDDNLWPIQCFLCRWTYITNERKFRSHIRSDRHLENLKKAETEPPNAEEYRQIYEQVYSDRNNLKNPIKIYPGEDIAEITPEYADRLLPIKVYKWDNPPSEKVTEELTPDIIMDYNKTCPILGLCYGFKMATDEKVRYHCALCSEDLSELNAYQHFVSIEHSLAYADAHYNETFNMLPADMSAEQKIDVIRYYYKKIEEWKGHRPFYLVNANYFDTLKDRFLPRVLKIYHYNENTVKFPEEHIMNTIEQIKSGEKILPEFLDKLPNQPETEDDCLKIDTSSEAMPKEDECEQERNRRRRDRNSSMKRPNDESDNDRAKRLGLDDSPANWQKYRIYCDKALRNLNIEYSRFFDISERHPKYQEEWRRFYRMRSDQLRRDRMNPNDYNYMPDWNRYWMRYLEDCYNADAEKCRFEIRKTLKLPFRCRTPPPTDNIIGNISAASTSASTSDTSSSVKKGPVPLMDLAISNPFMCNFPSGIVGGDSFGPFGNCASRANDPVGLGDDDSSTIEQPQPLMTDEQLNCIQQQTTENSGPISVLSVLRLLAALECELGSLGPLVNQLLGKAVLYEKESKLSANELLHEEDYFTLFVTALEKLKGVILAGVITETKISATNRCINDLETILNLFDEYLRRNPNAAKKHIKSTDVLAASRTESEIENNTPEDAEATASSEFDAVAPDNENFSNFQSQCFSQAAGAMADLKYDKCLDEDGYSADDDDTRRQKSFATGADQSISNSHYNFDCSNQDDPNLTESDKPNLDYIFSPTMTDNPNNESEISSLLGGNFRKGNPFASSSTNW